MTPFYVTVFLLFACAVLLWQQLVRWSKPVVQDDLDHSRYGIRYFIANLEYLDTPEGVLFWITVRLDRFEKRLPVVNPPANFSVKKRYELEVELYHGTTCKAFFEYPYLWIDANTSRNERIDLGTVFALTQLTHEDWMRKVGVQ